MEREQIRITESGSYEFGNNYELIFKDSNDFYLDYCNIICGNDCKIKFGGGCNIICGNYCEINCVDECNITCGINCEIKLHFGCYIKAGEGTKLKSYYRFLKTISKNKEFIWWYLDKNYKLINTFEDVDWRNKYPDKWKELYPFVHNELNSVTLF